MAAAAASASQFDVSWWSMMLHRDNALLQFQCYSAIITISINELLTS
jgi:hypothetical protein